MTRRQMGTWLLGLLVMMMSVPALAQESKAELQQRFKQRYAQLLAMKDAGKIGETWHGWVEPVAGDLSKAERELVRLENADRRALYAIIAEETRTTPELVAQRNAVRNFQKAKADHYLQGKDGKWAKKGREKD